VPEDYKPAGGREAVRARAAAARPPQRKRPGELTFFIVLVDVLAILRVLGALFIVVGGIAATAGGARGDISLVGATVLALGLVVGLIYLGVLVVWHFLWNGHNWARMTMGVLMVLAILQSLPINPMQTPRTGAAGIVPWLQILIAALFIVVLLRQDVKDYCSG